MSNSEYQTQSNIQIECRISNIKLNPIFKSNVEYRISNSISHSNFECRISNIKLNPTIIECRISNIKLNPHSNRMSNIEYQTQPNIQIECRISNIKLNPTFKSNVEYRISNSISHSIFECRISHIKLNPTFKSNVEYRISNSISHSNRLSNIKYQTQSNIQIECRISNIKLNPTFKF